MTYAQIAMTVVVAVLIGVILFIACVAAAIRKRKNTQTGEGPLSDFYNGGRKTGPFVLAMTMLTTYLSASSFLGGPGLAYEKGLAWVYLAVIQIPVIFLTLGVLGKKLGTVSRAVGAVTVNDVLRARYESPLLVVLCSLSLIVFSLIQITAQIKGGAIVFQTITGLNYERALMLFGALVVLFTVLGGFAGQSVANTLFGILMVVGCVTLMTLLTRASSNGNVAETMTILHPGWDSVSGADGTLTPAYMFSFWVLVGFGVLGLPQTAACGASYRDTKALNKAIPLGTLLLAFVILSIHLVGAYAPLLISMPEVKILLGGSVGTDYVLPGIVLKYMSPLAAGLFFAAPLAAVLSSVNALLLSSSAALMKDLYVNYLLKDKSRAEEPSFRTRAALATFLIATGLVFVAWHLLQIEPFGVRSIVKLNLTALGGLECAFFFPLVGGLYWRKATAEGAVYGLLAGVVLYAYLIWNDFRPAGFLPVVPALMLSGAVFWFFSRFGSGKDQEPPETFFPRR